MRHLHVVRPRQPRDAVQQNHHVLAELHHAPRLLDHHLRHLHVPRRRFVERRADHFTVHRPLHVRHLFRPLVDQQHDDVALGTVVQDGVGDELEQHGLAGIGRRDDEPALSLADRNQQVHDAHRDVASRMFEHQPLVRKERGEVVEVHAVLQRLGVLVVDRLHPQEREVTFLLLRRTDLSRHDVPRPQAEPPDLRGRNVYVVGTRKVVVIG